MCENQIVVLHIIVLIKLNSVKMSRYNSHGMPYVVCSRATKMICVCGGVLTVFRFKNNNRVCSARLRIHESIR